MDLLHLPECKLHEKWDSLSVSFTTAPSAECLTLVGAQGIIVESIDGLSQKPGGTELARRR